MSFEWVRECVWLGTGTDKEILQRPIQLSARGGMERINPMKPTKMRTMVCFCFKYSSEQWNGEERESDPTPTPSY